VATKTTYGKEIANI